MNSRANYLIKKLDLSISSFKIKKNSNRKNAIRIKFSTIVLGALVSILLGIKDTNNQILENIALIISIIVTSLTMIEQYFSNTKLWLHYSNTYVQLKNIQTRLEFYYSSGNIDDERLEELFEQYNNVLNNSNIIWDEVRNTKK